jgi:hypothetical protein
MLAGVAGPQEVEGMRSTLARARRLYRGYRTTSREYRELASVLGYTPGDLNKRFSAEHAAADERRRRAEARRLSVSGSPIV